MDQHQQKQNDSLVMSEDDSFKVSAKNISWIEWHCLIEGHEFLVQVSSFIDKISIYLPINH